SPVRDDHASCQRRGTARRHVRGSQEVRYGPESPRRSDPVTQAGASVPSAGGVVEARRRKAMAAKRKSGNRKVKRAMHELKHGKLRSGGSGKKVKSKRQAIAIGLSEARRSGARIPRKKVRRRK